MPQEEAGEWTFTRVSDARVRGAERTTAWWIRGQRGERPGDAKQWPAWRWLRGGGTLLRVSEPLRAEDLLPLIAKLPRDQRVRLAELALSAAGTGDAAVYATVPVPADELASDDDSLGWDAEGWDEFLPPR